MMLIYSSTTVLFIKVYTLERTIVRAEATKKGAPADVDLEKGASASGEDSQSGGRLEGEEHIRPSYAKDRETPDVNADDATVRPGTAESKVTKEFA